MNDLDPQQPAPDAPSAEEVRAAFYLGASCEALVDPAPLGRDNALQKLGKPPFERSARSKFRLLGFLATVYEHVSEDVSRRTQPEVEDTPAASDDAESGTGDREAD